MPLAAFYGLLNENVPAAQASLKRIREGWRHEYAAMLLARPVGRRLDGGRRPARRARRQDAQAPARAPGILVRLACSVSCHSFGEMKPHLDKFGSIGAVIAAAACPICFPKLALLGALFGLGGLAAYESQLIIAAQALVVLAAAGHLVAQRSRWLPGLALLGAITFFSGLYLAGSEFVAYVGLAVLVVASAIDLWLRLPRRQSRS